MDDIVERLRHSVRRVGKPLVECATCGNHKQPLGRSAPFGAYYCNPDCRGYEQPPYADNLWPDEPTMYEYVIADWLREAATEIERLREKLGRIVALGHNDDCIFCGLKDKEAKP